MAATRRLASRRQVLRGLAAAAAATAAGCGNRPREVYRWGSSSLGSSGYVIMEAFAQAANRHAGLRHASLATAGTAENLFLLGDGKLEFAHSTSVDWAPALGGASPYPRPVPAVQLFAYATWQQLPLVAAASDLQDLADLASRRFSPSQPGSGTATLFRTLLAAAGLGDAVRWRYGSWSEVYTAFRAGQIECVVGVFTNGRPSGWIRQLEATLALRPLPVPAAVIARARAQNPGILAGRLAADDWPAASLTAEVPAMTGIVACRPDIPEAVAYAVTRAILDRAGELRGLGTALAGLSADAAAANLLTSAPVHAGAARYFRERGLWRDTLTVAG